ncbi:hypothetical protein AHAS_Ahas14G0175600 [Arachis hypogaea]
MTRQDAAFVSLEALVVESGKEIFDFNYQVTHRCKEQFLELHLVSNLFVEARAAELEKENALLRERLAAYQALHGCRVLGFLVEGSWFTGKPVRVHGLGFRVS